jgi:hypothetical protein
MQKLRDKITCSTSVTKSPKQNGLHIISNFHPLIKSLNIKRFNVCADSQLNSLAQ